MVDIGLVFDLRVREHHGAEDGHLPPPIVAAGAIAAVTSRVTLLQALVVMLHDPIELAEQLDKVVIDHPIQSGWEFDTYREEFRQRVSPG